MSLSLSFLSLFAAVPLPAANPHRAAIEALTDLAIDGDWDTLIAQLTPASPLEGDCNNDPLLVLATRQGEEAAVEALLALGANPNAKSLHGEAVLLLSIDNCPAETTMALLKAGASPDATTLSGTPALAVALRSERFDVLISLVKAGASLSKEVRFKMKPFWKRASNEMVGVGRALGLEDAQHIKVQPRFRGA